MLPLDISAGTAKRLFIEAIRTETFEELPVSPTAEPQQTATPGSGHFPQGEWRLAFSDGSVITEKVEVLYITAAPKSMPECNESR